MTAKDFLFQRGIELPESQQQLMEDYASLKINQLLNKTNDRNETITENIKFNLIVLLYDIIRGYTFEISPGLRQGLKKYTNNADNHLRILIKKFDSLIADDVLEFGDDSDKLREYIEEYVAKSINYNNLKK